MNDYPKSLQDAKNRNERAGFHWFDRDTVRYFGTRIHSTFYSGGFFVTSEFTGWDRESRAFSVRRAMPDGSVDTVGEFLGFATRSAAHSEARRLSAEFRASEAVAA
jgi:hypothetical protein